MQNTKKRSGFYGPVYPVYGKVLDPDGSVLYEGLFKARHKGSLGWPEIVEPADFNVLFFYK